jgi:anti-sigma B factor antagonist
VELSTDTVDGVVTVVAVTGDVDMSTAPQLEQQLTELADNGATSLVVDLSGVDFLDSSALGVLVGMHKRLAANSGAVKLVCGHPRIERIFAITRLTEVLPVFDSVAAATAAD